MAALLKVLGIGVAGVAGLAAVYLVGQAEDSMPDWYPASDDTSATNDYGTGKYANKYQRYLVGAGKVVTGQEGLNNDKWWDWVFRNRYSSYEAKDGFKNIENGTKLKEACVSSYKGTGNNGTITENSKTYKEEDIWKYCSSGGTRIKTLSEVEGEKNSYSDSSSYAKTSGNDGKLVSITDNDSNWFWDLKEKELFEAKSDPSQSDKSESVFKALWNNRGTLEKSDHVKNKCKEAYGKNISTDEAKYPSQDVFKFCSLSGNNS